MLTAVHTDIAHARTPAAAFYTDAQILRAERERVFARAWQLVGQAGQLATPGDFFTTTLFEEPVLLVNDAGVLRGFFNVCRHRAGPVALGCGRQRMFACRYHGWTYDLGGRLLRAPETDGIANFDTRQIALEPIAVQALYYWLFPNMMLNIYQGQMQANIVIPQGVERSVVRFEWFAPEPLPDVENDARWRELSTSATRCRPKMRASVPSSSATCIRAPTVPARIRPSARTACITFTA